MEDRDVDEWLIISERRINWWLGFLAGLWYTINWGTQIVIEFFKNQQDSIPFIYGGPSTLFPHLIICVSGVCILELIFKRFLPPTIEFFFVLSAILLCFAVSDWKSSWIEHFIIDSELKEMCYKTVITLFNSSQLLFIPIWCGIRFKKQTPLEYRKLNYFIVFVTIPIICLLTPLIFILLREFKVMPIKF